MSFGKIKIFLPNGPWFQHPGQPAAVAWRRRNRDHFDVLLTELPDVAAAQKARLSPRPMIGCPKDPDR
jgi:hypothetical protein